MTSLFSNDPGPCGICGAAHTACTATGAAVQVTQLPATAAARLASATLSTGTDGIAETAAPPLVADIVQKTLPPNHFTSATYRRKK